MPKAKPFITLGRFNGFPYCPAKIDVSDYEWITLGGTQKGNSPTPEEIDLSYRNAMKLYWNIFSVKGLVSLPSGESLDSAPITDEPKSRICYDRFSSVNSISENLEDSEGSWLGDTAFGSMANKVAIIVKMYNGSTDNEVNFVGYGLGGSAFSIVLGLYIGDDTTPARINLASFAEEFPEDSLGEYNKDDYPILWGMFGPNPDGITDWEGEEAYVDVGGIWFLSIAASDASSSASFTTNVSNMSAEADIPVWLGGGKIQGKIDSLEFYTYKTATPNI